LPPAPANMSMRTVFEFGVKAAKSSATLLLIISNKLVSVNEYHTLQLAQV
jgi:hypothetical protein